MKELWWPGSGTVKQSPALKGNVHVFTRQLDQGPPILTTQSRTGAVH